MLEYIKNEPVLIIVLLAISVAALFTAVVIAGSARSRDRKLLRALEERLRREGDRQTDTVLAFNRLLTESTEKMDQRQDRLSRTLDGRLAESFNVVNRQLADVHRGLGEMRALAETVTDLKKLFGNVKTRGVWGEVQLHALLEETLAPGQYTANAQTQPNTQLRVEFAVRMPSSKDDEECLLPVDSKFPQEDFLRLAEASAAGDGVATEKYAAQLEKALMEQARSISEKYIHPPYTTDYAVMFLPAESLYAEAARRPGLIEKMQTKHRVLVAGPATLAALLTSLRMGFRTCTLEKKSADVMRLLSETRAEMTKYDAGIEHLRQRLEQAQHELEELSSRSRRISRKLRAADEEQDQEPENN